MRDAADVEPQAVAPSTSTSGDQRAGPARQPLHQRRIASRIGRLGDQRRIERPRIGQPRASPRAAFGGGSGHGMDDRPVRALDGQDDRLVRRTVAATFAQRSIARCGNQMEAPASCATLHRPGGMPRARNNSASHAGAPGARGSSGLGSDGALAIRQRIRAPLRLALPPSRTSQHGHAADRSAATASRRVAVKSSARGIAPHLADHGGQAGAS